MKINWQDRYSEEEIMCGIPEEVGMLHRRYYEHRRLETIRIKIRVNRTFHRNVAGQ